MEHAVGLSRLGREGNAMQIGGGTARHVGGLGVAEGLVEEEDFRMAVSESGFAAG